ncbi:MAG TPA: hypothetical protein P5081_07175 [Phycisphaerae bacterium]|nr:hypothetical protein [Phycisphaerae bacterium]HRW52652.1 hypothetical protein [Phycisphaerae bacterium]
MIISDSCFAPLDGYPFEQPAANRILQILEVLERFKVCFDQDGQRSAEGHEIARLHFQGDRAMFSDSSDTEKQDFEHELSFRHPLNESETLFCPWHGKVNTPKFRVHFSWPVTAKDPLFVVYVGPKITKR